MNISLSDHLWTNEYTTEGVLDVDWDEWRQMPTARLTDVVLLSMGICPRNAWRLAHSMSIHSVKFKSRQEYLDRLMGYLYTTQEKRLLLYMAEKLTKEMQKRVRIITANSGLDEPFYSLGGEAHEAFRGYDDLIQLGVAAAWMKEQGWELPEQFAELADASQDVPIQNFAHETPLLRVLHEAAHQWWSSYDPENPGTAPTNDEVEKWLIKERKVSKRVAAVMAQILRAEGLPSGRRPK